MASNLSSSVFLANISTPAVPAENIVPDLCQVILYGTINKR